MKHAGSQSRSHDPLNFILKLTVQYMIDCIINTILYNLKPQYQVFKRALKTHQHNSQLTIQLISCYNYYYVTVKEQSAQLYLSSRTVESVLTVILGLMGFLVDFKLCNNLTATYNHIYAIHMALPSVHVPYSHHPMNS